jgi:hypothetical protein
MSWHGCGMKGGFGTRYEEVEETGWRNRSSLSETVQDLISAGLTLNSPLITCSQNRNICKTFNTFRKFEAVKRSRKRFDSLEASKNNQPSSWFTFNRLTFKAHNMKHSRLRVLRRLHHLVLQTTTSLPNPSPIALCLFTNNLFYGHRRFLSRSENIGNGRWKSALSITSPSSPQPMQNFLQQTNY